MKVFVTGSSGFIGFHLVKKLLSKSHFVVGIDNHNDYYDVSLKEHRKKILGTRNFKFYKTDLNDLKNIKGNFDLAINLAAQPGVRVKKGREHLYKHSNIKGFESFCDFCEKNKIKKIVYASSSSVYSDLQNEKFNETNSKLMPKSKYGTSKLANELYASKFLKNRDMTFIGLRFFSVYGPYGRPDMAYYLFTEALKKDEIIALHNHGNMERDMTYIDDVIDGILGAINFVMDEKNANQNHIFNLGNDKPIKTSYMLSLLEKYLQKTSRKSYVETKNEARITHANITKSKNLLGYDPKINLDEGIIKFLEWHKNYENL